jgi:hypothetical protein
VHAAEAAAAAAAAEAVVEVAAAQRDMIDVVGWWVSAGARWVTGAGVGAGTTGTGGGDGRGGSHAEETSSFRCAPGRNESVAAAAEAAPDGAGSHRAWLCGLSIGRSRLSGCDDADDDEADKDKSREVGRVCRREEEGKEEDSEGTTRPVNECPRCSSGATTPPPPPPRPLAPPPPPPPPLLPTPETRVVVSPVLLLLVRRACGAQSGRRGRDGREEPGAWRC